MTSSDLHVFNDRSAELAATIYRPDHAPKAAVLIGPATGIKRKIYTSFATHLAEQGYGVLTFENEGIGDSLTGSLKKCTASLQSWGESDLPAMLERLKEEFPDVKYHLFGHSAGGQLLGLMPNWKDLSSLFNFACSSGRIKNMNLSHRRRARFFMSTFIPANNFVFGYTKSQWVGMGEPLPKNCARQWGEWCLGGGYVKTAFGKEVKTHWYDEVNLPSIWINATDDWIANHLNVEDMISVHTKMKDTAERLTLDPKELGLKEIGHMKFFSRSNSVLWEHAINWLERHA